MGLGVTAAAAAAGRVQLVNARTAATSRASSLWGSKPAVLALLRRARPHYNLRFFWHCDQTVGVGAPDRERKGVPASGSASGAMAVAANHFC